ncbi:Protein Jade-1 [Merluccius polli]|uniref:Protein Jade-1 n=1 Tax=Merluccius polli TaxID=89951 RepID=A0AA47LZ86_MERPO|nr:Protein Jade-1 [Merluccius polli]
MKRVRRLSSSDESDHGSNSTCWSQHSQTKVRRSTGLKPSEVFRTDLITAMKVHDSHCLSAEDFYILADPWRQDWEKGVQVPVSPHSLPQPSARVVCASSRETSYTRPKRLVRTSGSEALGYVDIRTLAEAACRYDLNEDDQAWLLAVNQELQDMGMPLLDEITMETVMEEFERHCHDNMSHAMRTEEGLGIEYDDDVVCEVCHSPDGEDNNEMVFCDKCNICVHQACYGIRKVPEGSWLCRTCALGLTARCQLCPQRGGAMKPTRSGTKWAHVSCALWIPEVSIGNPEKMEPITNVSHIPSSRWALLCCICQDKTGACIQCSAKNCRTAFHVTCGLQAKLQMITFLTEEDEVKFKSYCPKHSGQEEQEEEGVADKRSRRRGRVRGEEEEQKEKRGNLRKLKLQQLEEDFFVFVEVQEVAEQLSVSAELVDFLFQYWKLKRKANFNQPLLTPKKEEEESLARREQEVLLRRLQLFTHLRQDLERVRNLSYMVTRREKLKRSLCRLQEQMFHKQLILLDQQLLSDHLLFLLLLLLLLVLPLPAALLTSSSSSAMKGRRLKADRKSRRRRSTDSPPRGPQGSVSSRTRHPTPDQNHGALTTPQERLQRGEGRRGLRREPPGPEEARPGGGGEEVGRRDEEQEDRKRKKRAVASENPAPRRLEKTVCVRLVDIRLLPPETPSSHLKTWGKFRIPKRGERSSPGDPLGPEAPRTRLRSGAENNPQAPPASQEVEPGNREAEPSSREASLKRCHSHQLRRDATLGRRYGNHIIRQGVLAS